MNTHTETFEHLAQKGHLKALQRLQQQKIAELVRLIDELSGEMGSADFRDAIRLRGYDIDACRATLTRRGVIIQN